MGIDKVKVFERVDRFGEALLKFMTAWIDNECTIREDALIVYTYMFGHAISMLKDLGITREGLHRYLDRAWDSDGAERKKRDN